MSLSILIISLIFALVQGGLSWLFLSMEALSYLPLVTGIIFALGMAVTFVIIMMSGGMSLSEKAGAFVRDHFGRTMALAVLSVLVMFVVSLLGEILYQADPLVSRRKGKADVCYLLDFSSSMNWAYDGNSSGNPKDRIRDLRTAFNTAVNTLDESQRVCVIAYDQNAEVIFDWAPMTAANRQRVIDVVNNRVPSGGTSFNKALQAADGKIAEALDDRRAANVIMISDGDDPGFTSVAANAPAIISNEVRINTLLLSTIQSDAVRLTKIAAETGGVSKDKVADVTELTDTMVEFTDLSSQSDEAGEVPDTLITPRTVSRKTIISAPVLRILLLFLMGFWFKLTAIICMGNNDTSMGPHLAHAFLVALIAALAVEFGLSMGLPYILVLFGFWVLMIAQIVRTNR